MELGDSERGHVERIREALWRPRSRATVMVGAGMSRNAHPQASGVAPFPLWKDILRDLFQELYPGKEPWVGIDVMQLGLEYAEEYGRAVLEDRLKQLTPDEQYEPGELHTRLLSLPWADVFTTNYDRLLERTLPVFERTYDVVCAPQDLAEAERPRIVKLHGSFPSHRPFVFTSEDYRTYPDQFAPFVNTVRQAVMESYLCLIGFSGDDPNFLQWIGWVRDQLGASMRHVYLCGVLDLSESRRRYLQSLRITPIDFGALFPKNNWDGRRHEVALDWFLTSLHNGRPVEEKGWPARKPDSPWEVLTSDEQMPAPLSRVAGAEIPSWPRESLPEEETTAYYDKVLAACEVRRQTYPGWVVCPEANRSNLVREILHWFYDRKASQQRAAWLREQPVLQRARALREFAWILRRSLMPLPDWIDELIVYTLEAFNPKPERIQLNIDPAGKQEPTERAALVTPRTDPSEDWEELTKVWVELAFALVNDAWQMQDLAKHERWMERLRGVIPLKNVWRVRYAHAQAWHHLVRLDEQGVRSVLDAWPDVPGQPFWQAKRAAVLAELGELKQARALARDALEQVRRAINRTRTDYVHRSQEGWILDLIIRLELQLALQGRSDAQGEAREDEHIKRLEELDADRCNPRTDFRRREQKLLALPSMTERRILEPGFGIGAYRSIYKVRSDFAEGWVLLQSVCDGVRSLGFYSSDKNSDCSALAIAVCRIWPESPRLAISTALRAGEGNNESAWKALHMVLDRAGVAELSQDTAGELYAWLAGALRSAMAQWSDRRPNTSALHQRLLERAPEIVSRLMLRVADEHLDEAFELVRAMHEHGFYQNGRVSKQLTLMWQRLFMATSNVQVQSWMPKILALDIPELGADRWDANFPEPSDYFQERVQRPSDDEQARWVPDIDTLIDKIRNGSPFVREHSCRRLVPLVYGNVLNKDQTRHLAEAIWSQCDSAWELPDNTGLYPHAFLHLPEPEAGHAERAVRVYFLEVLRADNFEKTSRNFKSYLTSLTGATYVPWRMEQEHCIRWTPQEQARLVEQLVSAWPKYVPRAAAAKTWQLVPDMFSALFGVLASSHGIRDAGTKDALLNSLQSLRRAMSESEPLWVEGRLFDLLDLDTEREASIAACAQVIRRALHGSDADQVESATRAIYYWHACTGPDRLFPEPPRYLLDDLIGHAVSRRQPGLSAALTQIRLIVQDAPAAIDPARVDALQRALDYMHEDSRPRISERTWPDGHPSPMARHERLGHYYLAAHLAVGLAKLLQVRDQPIPREVEAWREVAEHSPLPEVRRLWRTL